MSRYICFARGLCALFALYYFQNNYGWVYALYEVSRVSTWGISRLMYAGHPHVERVAKEECGRPAPLPSAKDLRAQEDEEMAAFKSMEMSKAEIRKVTCYACWFEAYRGDVDHLLPYVATIVSKCRNGVCQCRACLRERRAIIASCGACTRKRQRGEKGSVFVKKL